MSTGTKVFHWAINLLLVGAVLSGSLFFLNKITSGQADWKTMPHGEALLVVSDWELHRKPPPEDRPRDKGEPSYYTLTGRGYPENQTKHYPMKVDLPYDDIKENTVKKGMELKGYYLNENGTYKFDLNDVPMSNEVLDAKLFLLGVLVGGFFLVRFGWRPVR